MNARAGLLVAVLVVVGDRCALAQTGPKQNGAPPPVRSSVHPNGSAGTSLPGLPGLPESRVPPRPPPPPQQPASAPSPFAAGPSTYAPHYTSPLSGRPRRPGPYSGYAGSYWTGLPTSEPADPPSDQSDASGTIVLDVEPRSALVFVDGFYIGTVDDFSWTGVMLPAGRHWIEVRASGYEPQTIPVSIAAGQPTRYRGVLAVTTAPAAQTVSARGQGTMYVIPGCYAGNRPPRESSLARRCDIAGLLVLTAPR